MLLQIGSVVGRLAFPFPGLYGATKFALEGLTESYRYEIAPSATPPDPQEVTDAVARVIAQPAGERPLRTVVAIGAQRQAPQAVNDAVA